MSLLKLWSNSINLSFGKYKVCYLWCMVSFLYNVAPAKASQINACLVRWHLVLPLQLSECLYVAHTVVLHDLCLKLNVLLGHRQSPNNGDCYWADHLRGWADTFLKNGLFMCTIDREVKWQKDQISKLAKSSTLFLLWESHGPLSFVSWKKILLCRWICCVCMS